MREYLERSNAIKQRWQLFWLSPLQVQLVMDMPYSYVASPVMGRQSSFASHLLLPSHQSFKSCPRWYLVWAQTYHSKKGFSQFQRKTKCGTISLALDQTPNGFEAIVFIADNFIKKAGDLEAIDAYRKKFGPVRWNNGFSSFHTV